MNKKELCEAINAEKEGLNFAEDTLLNVAELKAIHTSIQAAKIGGQKAKELAAELAESKKANDELTSTVSTLENTIKEMEEHVAEGDVSAASSNGLIVTHRNTKMKITSSFNIRGRVYSIKEIAENVIAPGTAPKKGADDVGILDYLIRIRSGVIQISKG